MKECNTLFRLVLAALLAGALAGGCSSHKEEEAPADSALREVRFEAGIGSFEVKATDSAFERGDAIGISAGWPINAYDCRYRWGGNGLVPDSPIYWPSDDTYASFFAYYPYGSLDRLEDPYWEGVLLGFCVNSDQSMHALFTGSDLMTAYTGGHPGMDAIWLGFKHRMAKIVISIEDYRSEPLDIADVYLANVQGRVLCRPEREEYEVYGESGAIKTCPVETLSGDPAWAVIIPPQYVRPALIITTTGGEQFTFDLESEVRFTSGTRTFAHVTIDDSCVGTDFTSDVTEWTDNKDIVFSDDEGHSWSIIGSATGWNQDYMMDNPSKGIHTIEFNYREGDTFKFRRDQDWTYNYGLGDYGGVALAGEGEYTLQRGGADIALPQTGRWKAELDAIHQTVIFTLISTEIVIDGIAIDGDFSDWEAIDQSKLSIAKCAYDAPRTALRMMKAFADEDYIYIYFEWDQDQIYHEPNVEHVPLHVYLNTDGDESTGGCGGQWSDLCTDVLLEGFIYPDGASVGSYDPNAYYWSGETNAEGWSWDELLGEGEGLCLGAGHSGKYELLINRSILASAGYPVADVFSLGIDIQQSWDSVGILPNANITESNPKGLAKMLPVYTGGAPVGPTEEVTIWEGYEDMGDWTNQPYVGPYGYFTSHDVPAGSVLRFYVTGYEDYYMMQIYDGNWNGPMETFDSDMITNGYFELQLDQALIDRLNALYDWGGLFVVQGQSCVLTKITLVTKATYQLMDDAEMSLWNSDWNNYPYYEAGVGTWFNARARLNRKMPFGSYTFRWSNITLDPSASEPLRIRHWFCFNNGEELKCDIRPADGRISFSFNSYDGVNPQLDPYYDVDFSQPIELTYKFDWIGNGYCHVSYLVNGVEAASFNTSKTMLGSVTWGSDINIYIGVDQSGSAVLEWYKFEEAVRGESDGNSGIQDLDLINGFEW